MRRFLHTTIIVLACSLCGPAHAREKFKRLSAEAIHAQIIGKVVTDEAHWAHHFYPDGSLKVVDLGEPAMGTWKVQGKELCLIQQERKKTTTDC